MISVSIRKGGRQVQTVVLESTEKFLKQQIKLFQKVLKSTWHNQTVVIKYNHQQEHNLLSNKKALALTRAEITE